MPLEGETTYGLINTLMLLPAVSERSGMQALQQNLAGLINGVLQTNLYAAQEIFRAATPEAVLELQQRFVCDYIAALINGTMTLVRTIQETADQALRRTIFERDPVESLARKMQ
jgi:predicted lipoprotein